MAWFGPLLLLLVLLLLLLLLLLPLVFELFASVEPLGALALEFALSELEGAAAPVEGVTSIGSPDD